MKKIKITGICIVCIMLGIFIWENASECAQASYLALGDSISTGYGLEKAEQGFVDILARQVGYSADNYAVNGSTADDVLALVESGKLDEKIKSAQLVTITCGGNDMMKVLYEECAEAFNAVSAEKIQSEDVLTILSDVSDVRNKQLMACAWEVLLGNGKDVVQFTENTVFKESLSKYGENIGRIIGYIRALNTEAVIVMPTQYNPYKAFAGFLSVIKTGVGNGVLKLNEAITENSIEYGYRVADVYSAFENDSRNLCNANAETMNLDFHPNADGHALIAECIAKAIGVNNIFEDVNTDHPFYDAISFVKEHKIFNGVTETEFSPETAMTRAMVVTVLHRMEELPVAEESGFSDVAADEYYYGAVNWAKANGIVNGKSKTEFAPNDCITREQLAAIMLRYAKLKGTAPQGAWAIRLDYSDLAQISDYAGEAVMYCTMTGMMLAKSEKAFAPKDNATRAEVALAIQKFVQKNAAEK